MEYRKLGKTDIQVSAVAMGCWAMAGDAIWGPQDDADSIAAVHAALDAGINFFDTAEGYGNGRSEEVLGRALAGRRHEAVIATKMNPNHLSAAELPKACEASLGRLRTDYIDLYQVHWPNWSIPAVETMGALEELRRQGKVRAIGVCNYGVRDLSEALAAGSVVTDQLSYSLIWRALEYEIRTKCIEKGVGILTWGSLSEGLLTGKFASADDVPVGRLGTRHFKTGRPGTSHGEPGCEKETFAAIERIRQIADELHEPMPAVALAWLLAQPGVTSVLAGARRPEQITANARAAELKLSTRVIGHLSAATKALKQKLGPNQDMYLPLDQTRIR